MNLYLQKTGSSDERAWVFTAPDRTQFYFDVDGYQSALVDANGNELSFTYERRRSNNKPIKFLQYLTDPHERRTLSIDYYTKGQDFTYIDDNGTKQAGNNLTNPKITDLAEMTDGAGAGQPKVFGFGYDAEQGNNNVKLVEVTDPRGNTTELGYFDSPTDPKAKWLLETLTDRAGGQTTFGYVDPDGPHGDTVETTVTDAHDQASVYVTDGYGRPVREPAGRGHRRFRHVVHLPPAAPAEHRHQRRRA